MPPATTWDIRAALARNADYVLVLNNDTLVERHFLEPLVEYAEAHETVGSVGPKVVDQDGRIDLDCARRRPTLCGYFFRIGLGRLLIPNNRWIREHYYRGEYSFDRPKEVDILSGCCMLLQSRVLQELGLFDEGTFLFLEEFILHERLRSRRLHFRARSRQHDCSQTRSIDSGRAIHVNSKRRTRKPAILSDALPALLALCRRLTHAYLP